VDAPGDLIHIDTVKIRLQSDGIRFQFSARDAFSRWDCSLAYRRASSFSAAVFLEYMERRFPFPIRAIQIDGGSESKKHFEEVYRGQTICFFIIPLDAQSCKAMWKDRVGRIVKSFMKWRILRSDWRIIIGSWSAGTRHITSSGLTSRLST
jgi:hypothetical protein